MYDEVKALIQNGTTIDYYYYCDSILGSVAVLVGVLACGVTGAPRHIHKFSSHLDLLQCRRAFYGANAMRVARWVWYVCTALFARSRPANQPTSGQNLLAGTCCCGLCACKGATPLVDPRSDLDTPFADGPRSSW